jgi:hypothetical protein
MSGRESFRLQRVVVDGWLGGLGVWEDWSIRFIACFLRQSLSSDFNEYSR